MSVQHHPIPDKTVVLTFDDGSISQLRNAGPLLKELGFGATFCAPPAAPGRARGLRHA
jgi:peptidoglycan/xylan/chitin deacetylase (PgdA/CDA1 family)